MKTIGIRGVSPVGIRGVSDVNVVGNKNKISQTEKVKLRIGVFFDGTGNNRYNSDSVYYNKKYHSDIIIEDDVPKVKHKNFEVKPSSSYWNSYSNVALLHDLYEEKLERDPDPRIKFQELQLKFYEEGIGTLQDEEDDDISGMIGSGLGEGPRGVIARVENTCNKIAEEITKALQHIQDKKPLEIISIQFDVFGFSRGAAAARHFCNEVLKTKNIQTPLRNEANLIHTKDNQPTIKELKKDAFKKVIDKNTVAKKNIATVSEVFSGGALGAALKGKFPKHNVTVEFLGLFDTVISQMLERKGIIDSARNPIVQALANGFSPILGMATKAVSFIPKVNPDVSNPSIKKILHLRAQTEWRDNFPITPVTSYASNSFVRQFSVFGAHSDIGGGYWQTKEELTTLHFFDLSVNASTEEKQKLEQQKELLRNWYISKNLCHEKQIEWKTMHHVRAYTLTGSMDEDLESHINKSKYMLLDEKFMGSESYKKEGEWHYALQGYHYKLISTRPLNNKLSLVYMNVMKYIATTYAHVPFTLPVSETPHPEEYKYPEDYSIPDNEVYNLLKEDKDIKKTDLKKFENLMIKIAEHGWKDEQGNIITYPSLFTNENQYAVNPDMYEYIMGNFVHLSANFNSPLLDALDHFNLVYANVPHFTNEKDFQDPPYKREVYTPELDAYDNKP